MFSKAEFSLATDHRPARRRIGRFTVVLHSDSTQVTQDFSALYPAETADSADTGAPIQIEVRRVGRSRIGRALYRVLADGDEIGGWRPLSGLFPLIEWGINLRIIARRSEFLQFHAASMGLRGNGFVFAGDSGCGKSTLAAILLSRGWRYLCDEFAMVEPKNLSLQPFPKAICIKAGSFPIIDRLELCFARNRDYIKGPKGRVGYINPGHQGTTAVGETLPCRFIVFPAFCGRAVPRLEVISRTSTAMHLLRCAFNRHAFGDSALPVLARLVSESACFRLEVGDPAETGKLLESLVPVALPISPAVEKQVSTPPLSTHANRVSRLQSRRQILRLGAKMAYVAPAVAAFSAHEALAATSNPSGICSTASHTGELCETDTDCCSRQCNLGICE